MTPTTSTVDSWTAVRVPGQAIGRATRLQASFLSLSLSVVVLLVVLGPVAGCADPSGTLLILQNQVPTTDSTSGACVFSADSTESALSAGQFDVDLDQPYPYYVYPLIQSRLPSIKTSGGIERNTLLLKSVRVSIKAPAGVDPAWSAGCPASFDSPATSILDPGDLRAVRVQAFRTCHAQHLRELIAAAAIPADLSQSVFFTVNLTAIADRSGSEQTSAVFPFNVQVCAGCLQSMYPVIPSCAAAPKPNLLRGNPCNIAQEGPPVLCCTDPGGAVVCPAPDM